MKKLAAILAVLFCLGNLPAQVSRSMAYRVATLESSGGGGGAFSFVNSDSASAEGGSTVTTGGAVDFSGSKVFAVEVSTFSGSTTCVDSEGNTYTAGTAIDEGDGHRITRIYRCLNPTIDPAMTFTATGNDVVIVVKGFGCTGAPVFDAEATGFGSGSATTFQAGGSLGGSGSELIVGAITWENGTASIDSGFSDPNVNDAGGSALAGAESYKISSSAENPTWTVTGAGSIGGSVAMMSFKLSGGGGGSPLIAGSSIYYKLDDNTGTTAADASVNALTGTFNGSPAWAAPYIGVSSVQFHGGSDSIASATSATLDATGNDESTAVWFKTSTSGSVQVVCGIANVGAGKYNLVELDSNGFIVAACQGSGGSPTSISDAAQNFADGNWHHVVTLLDHTALKVTLWVDGANIGTASSATGGTLDFGGVFCVAQFGAAGGFGFTGFEDEPSVYPFTLNSTQIGNLFNQTHP